MNKSFFRFIAPLLLAAVGTAGAVGAPAGNVISNVGSFEYVPDGAPTTTATVSSASVDLTVTQVYDVDVNNSGTNVTPGQTIYVRPGQPAQLTYTVTNLGNGNDIINLTVLNHLGTPLPGAQIYEDLNGNGTYDSATEQLYTSVNLPADGSKTFNVIVPTNPSNFSSRGGTSTFFNFVAQSMSVDGSTLRDTDNDNVAAVTFHNVQDYTFSSSYTGNGITGQVVTVAHSFSNTGNTPIDPTTLNFSVVSTGILANAGANITYTVYNNGTLVGTGSDLGALMATAGNLLVGQGYDIQVNYTLGQGVDGDSGTSTLSVTNTTPNQTTTAPYTYNDNTTANSLVDSFVLNQGVVNLTKIGLYCGTDSSCTSPTPLGSATVVPGDYVRYVVTVSNTGSAPISFPTLRDYVPFNTVFHNVTGTTKNGAGAIVATTMYAVSPVSTRGSLVWNGAPTTLATSNAAATSGPFLFAGPDTNGDLVVNSNDMLAPNHELQMVLTVQVRNTGPSN